MQAKNKVHSRPSRLFKEVSQNKKEQHNSMYIIIATENNQGDKQGGQDGQYERNRYQYKDMHPH